MSGSNSLKLLLDIYQQSRMNGEWASLLMETKNGKVMITFSIEIAPARSSAGTWNPGNKQSRRRKTPSDHRRDESRKSEFIAKKTKESNESSVKAKLIDPVKVVLVEPKDEMELVEPELKDEKEVNYVGEYIYDKVAE